MDYSVNVTTQITPYPSYQLFVPVQLNLEQPYIQTISAFILYFVLVSHCSLNAQVLVIAHIPPGDTECHGAYGEFYLNMTRRFSDTIVGHLFGHTHNDQIQLVRCLFLILHGL